MRELTFTDKTIKVFDTLLQTLIPPQKRISERPNPAEHCPIPPLTIEETKHIAGLVRVNHAGEVCAQALYLGQSLTAHHPETKQKMNQAAQEEIDHLAWCETRLRELNSKPSILNPLWFFNAFFLGLFTGLISDQWSLGFVAETEKQVTMHLETHLDRLPPQDQRTQALFTQMKQDEMHHAQIALESGGTDLPFLIKQIMHVLSKFLTTSSYYV